MCYEVIITPVYIYVVYKQNIFLPRSIKLTTVTTIDPNNAS